MNVDMTARQRRVLDATMAVLEPDDRIVAAWLGGSFGQGTADEWSDVDVHCCVADGALASIEAELDAIRTAIMPTVFDLKQGAAAWGVVGFTAVAEDWAHVDVMFYDRAHVHPNGFVVLFDRGDVLPADSTWHKPNEPWWPKQIVETFLYSVGQQPIVVGRDDVPLMQQGVIILRETFLLPLMHAENGHAPAGGMMRYSRHLTDSQRAELLTMPPITSDRDDLLACHAWLARCFVPRARALAARLGVDYPDALETAALRQAGVTL